MAFAFEQERRHAIDAAAAAAETLLILDEPRGSDQCHRTQLTNPTLSGNLTVA